MKIPYFILLLLFAFVSGCAIAPANFNNHAPVIDLDAVYAKQHGYYVVKPHETLFLIAWRLDMDFQQLAAINNLRRPYGLAVGQRLYLNNNKKFTTDALQKKSVREQEPKQIVAKAISNWRWPAKGKLIAKYSAENRGINIAGQAGEAIIATADGTIVYVGNGLSAYGNLIIIKHNNTYLSAYAHNKNILVKEGQHVKQGQTIAHMGSTGTNRVMLHFEIRKYGKPVDPLRYLR